MQFLRIFALSFLLLFIQKPTLLAQNKMTWEEFVNYVAEEEEMVEGEEWIEHLEDLQQWALQPIDINAASKEDLLQLPFLSERQATEIREYVDYHHGMKTLAELRLITSLRPFEQRILPLFMKVGETKDSKDKSLCLKEMLSHHQHELLSRVDIPFYHRKGYLVEDGYRGSRIYNKVKYTFSATQHLQASFHTERDAGERGIDSYGGQVMLEDIKHLATFIAGDFRVGFGEGLVLNQGFSMGKTSLQSHPSQGLRAHTGTDESNFLRGAGATIRYGDFNVSAFLSRRKWDATLNADSTAKTIVSGGYHRTQTEYEKKGNMHVNVVGANVNWQKSGFHAGLTGYFLHSDRSLVPGEAEYRQIYPKGQDFAVAGINYGYDAYRWAFRGETAYSTEQGGIATLNNISWRASQRYFLTASQRYYNYHYYSFFSSAISENSSVQNETGATLRLDATPADGLQLYAYVDFFYNPWPRYGLAKSSSGQEGVLQMSCDLSRKNSLSARYSIKTKESSAGKQTHHRLRLQWICTPSDKWKLQTTAMLHTLRGSHGEAIGETVRFGQGTSLPLHFSLSGIYFHTTDYDSRVYLYEPNVVNTLSFPSFYGHGIRLSGTMQWAICKERIRFELKYGVTDFFDRDTQSSGLQTIYSHWKNDITLQLRLRI